MSYIILKFDDLNEITSPYFQMVDDFCGAKRIPVCFGLIGNSLNSPSKTYVSSLLNLKNNGVELWNHGFFHTEREFSDSFYNQQLDSIRSTQLLMKKYLGEAGVTFGSPHNNSTEVTVKILKDEFPEIKNYFFMVDAGGISDARQMVMRCNYEIETGIVDLDFFRNEYERIKKYPYFVMQGHPSFWRGEDFERFKEMISILVEDGNEFVTSRELSELDISGFAPELSKYWTEDMLAFFVSHSKTVLYGAGEIGRELHRFLNLKGIKPDAFVVSDGHKAFSKLCDIPVYELSEARNTLHDFAIVPAFLGKNHDSVFIGQDFSGMSIWKPQNGTYDEFIDYVRYVVSVESWTRTREVVG